MQPFREAATRAFLEDAQQLVPASIGSGGAWQALLAWMTRDQECRFGHLLDWRSPTSGSRSPVSGRSRPQDDREVIIRIVLNALLPQEIETKRRWETVNAALSNHRTQAGRLAWQLGHLRGRLAEYFGINTDSASRLDAKIIKEAASEHLAKVQGLPTAASLGQLRSARSDAERVFKKLADVQAAIEIASNKKESAEYLAKIMADQLPELSAQNQRLEHPVCPVCGVLIDKARAEGCGISLQGCDLEALRAKAAEQLGTWQNALSDAARLQAELTTLRGRLELANQELEQSRARLAGLERAMFDRSQDLSRAERAWDWALDFEQATTDLEETESAVGKSEDDLKALAEGLDAIGRPLRI